ncbi:peptidoglycan-binding protein [Kribbella sp. NPDC050124]|uniref:peptidoglycan-binding protein n=1 Tax=Kribbella sp. NPDC050124 TaxID=3364114 RepID=UPI00378F700B
MSTTAPTPNTAPKTAPKTRTWVIATVAAGCVAMVGIVAAAVVGVQGPSQASAGPAVMPAGTVQYHSQTGHRGNAPSASMELLQQQLAQLNYYNGPITGYQNAGTVNAIMYLQRDANLPQTGHLDQATRDALNSMLVHGNNQMAG